MFGPILTNHEVYARHTPHPDDTAGELEPIKSGLIDPDYPDIYPLFIYTDTHLLADLTTWKVDPYGPHPTLINKRAVDIARLSGLGIVQVPIGSDPEKEAVHIFPTHRGADPLLEHPHNHTTRLKIVRAVPPGWLVDHTTYEPVANEKGAFIRVANTRIITPEGDTHFIDTPLERVDLHGTTETTSGPHVTGETIERGVVHTLRMRYEAGTTDGSGAVVSFVDKEDFADPIPKAKRTDWVDEHRLTNEGTDKLVGALANMQKSLREGTLTDKSGKPIIAAEIGRTTMVYLRESDRIKQETRAYFTDDMAIYMYIGHQIAHAKIAMELVLYGQTISPDLGTGHWQSR